MEVGLASSEESEGFGLEAGLVGEVGASEAEGGAFVLGPGELGHFLAGVLVKGEGGGVGLTREGERGLGSRVEEGEGGAAGAVGGDGGEVLAGGAEGKGGAVLRRGDAEASVIVGGA